MIIAITIGWGSGKIEGVDLTHGDSRYDIVVRMLVHTTTLFSRFKVTHGIWRFGNLGHSLFLFDKGMAFHEGGMI